MKKNKNGFTLIELLGVIIVIAIVALISVPIIVGVIEKARIGALKATANGLLESADMYYAKNIDKVKSPVEFVITNGKQTSIEKLDYKGNVENGYLMLFKNNKKAICVDNGTHAASKSLTENEVTVQEGNCLGYDEEYKGYLVGGISSGFTSLDVKGITDPNNLGKGTKNAIRIITETKVTGFYVASVAPEVPSEGMVWVVQANNSPYYLESNNVRIGVSYAMQYESGKWNLKKAYVYNNDEWKLLYYVDMTDGNLNLENSNLDGIELEKNYEYTGEYQEFTAPFSGYYNIQAWGAQGGTYSNSYPGGLGAYTSGDIYLEVGSKLYIYVGGQGSTTASKDVKSGGWNGGGDAGNEASSTRKENGGGGATDIRTNATSNKNEWDDFDSLKSRIMVAAGGGAGSGQNGGSNGKGGAGGGLIGYNSSTSTHYGLGGGQTYGGRAIGYDSLTYNTSTFLNNLKNYSLALGSFGKGGSVINNAQEGGGGGWYGGGGAINNDPPGAGGSSYISGYEGCNSVSKESTKDNIVHTGSKYSWTNYYFINNKMIDGQGYTWNNGNIGSLTNQPTHDNMSSQIGNSGNGYAKITLKSIIQKEDNTLKYIEGDAWNYSYSKSYQKFLVPEDGIYKIELWGADGGTYSSSYPGGKGGYTSGEISLSKGETLYVYVGSKGKTSAYPIAFSGGWNGGGNSGGDASSSRIEVGGGGATDIRLSPTSSPSIWNEFDSLKSRIMVAPGGGGGSGQGGTNSKGGAGGGLIGYNGLSSAYYPTGGTQTASGWIEDYITNGYYYYSMGFFGAGASNDDSIKKDNKIYYVQIGGGGGYYGGGGGTNGDPGGAGGSAYISGHNGCNSISGDSTMKNIMHTGNEYHYSGKYFTNTIMIDGNEVLWDDIATSKTTIPQHYLINENGDGYARITLLKIKKDDLKKYDQNVWNYSYSKTYQTFTAPKNGYYKMELWGAQGGTYNKSYPGGLGAYTSGDIYLNVNEKLFIYVGGKGLRTIKANSVDAAGWNGGGIPGNDASSSRIELGGGGATDIRTVSTSSIDSWSDIKSLNSRIMVAAGGGAGSGQNGGANGKGGAGGGLIGYNGSSSSYFGRGGTQISGGYYFNTIDSTYNGGFGYGGNSQDGGGSGWYGGAGASNSDPAAGGGSSYISGHAGCIAINSSGQPKVQEYSTLSDSVSYTGYKFTNTQMIDGQGYSWTTEKSNIVSSMPTYNSNTTSTGNTGNGYARITYLGE